MESGDLGFPSRVASSKGDLLSEERPPLYNPEDYVAGLKRFSKLTGLQLYLPNNGASNIRTKENSDTNETSKSDKNGKGKSSKGSSSIHNDDDDGGGQDDGEMGLRQFRTISELLAKLKSDLSASFPSFQREFVAFEPASTPPSAVNTGSTSPTTQGNDGVTRLLGALKAVQLAQTNISGSLNQLGSRANHVMLKRALADEYETLLCLKIVCSRNEEGAHRLADHPSGLFTVAVCVMSNYSKSRVLSLQLLAKLCDVAGGHKQVSDAISMLRVRFGEPVRFKFLVGMLNSYNSCLFQVACLRFFNKFIETSKDSRERIMIQTELEEAGLKVAAVARRMSAERKAVRNGSPNGGTKKGQQQHEDSKCDLSMLLEEEIDRWNENYIDINSLVKKLLTAERENRRLREEINRLKKSAVTVSKVKRTPEEEEEDEGGKRRNNREDAKHSFSTSHDDQQKSLERMPNGANSSSLERNKNEENGDKIVFPPGEDDDQCDREFSETCFVSDDVMMLLPAGAKDKRNSNEKLGNHRNGLDDGIEATHVNHVEVVPSPDDAINNNSSSNNSSKRPPHPKPRRQDKASQATSAKTGSKQRQSGISADSGLSSEDSQDRLERRKNRAREASLRRAAEEMSRERNGPRPAHSQTLLISRGGRHDRLSSEEPSLRDRRGRNNIRRTKSFHITSELEEKPSSNENSWPSNGGGGGEKPAKKTFAFGDTFDRSRLSSSSSTQRGFSKSTDFARFLSRRGNKKNKENKNVIENGKALKDPEDEMRERRSSSSGGNNRHNSLFEMWEKRCHNGNEFPMAQHQDQQQQQPKTSSRSPQRKPIFPDWRQDTPFWNKQVCPVKPNPKANGGSGDRRRFEDGSPMSRAYEEPWYYYQQYASPPQVPPVVEARHQHRGNLYKHPVNGGNGYMFVSPGDQMRGAGGGGSHMNVPDLTGQIYLPSPLPSGYPPYPNVYGQMDYPPPPYFPPRGRPMPVGGGADRRSMSSGGSSERGKRRGDARSPFRNEFRLEITELDDDEGKVDASDDDDDFEEEFPNGEATRYDDEDLGVAARPQQHQSGRGRNEAPSHILDFPSGMY